MMGQKYQKETVFTNWGGDFYFYAPADLAAEKLNWEAGTRGVSIGWDWDGIDWVGPFGGWGLLKKKKPR